MKKQWMFALLLLAAAGCKSQAPVAETAPAAEAVAAPADAGTAAPAAETPAPETAPK